MLSLTTVMINSEDPTALSAFYTKVLGKPEWEDAGYVGWQAGGGTLMIGPHSEVKGPNETPGRIMINFETLDVKGEFARLKALARPCSRSPTSQVQPVARCGWPPWPTRTATTSNSRPRCRHNKRQS